MLRYDPHEAAQYLHQVDPVLGRVIEAVGPCRLEVRTMQHVFVALLRSIVYQQLSGKAAGTIYGRVEALFPDQTPTPNGVLALPDEALRGAGMSRAKTAAAKDLAAKTLEGTVPPIDVLDTLDDEEIIARLTAVRGIGPWTVEMVLMFRLGRPDVLPATDLGIRKAAQLLYHLDDLPKPKALRALAEPWRPYRTVASWYLWRHLD